MRSAASTSAPAYDFVHQRLLEQKRNLQKGQRSGRDLLARAGLTGEYATCALAPAEWTELLVELEGLEGRLGALDLALAYLEAAQSRYDPHTLQTLLWAPAGAVSETALAARVLS